MSESRCPVCQGPLDGTRCPGCGWAATGGEDQQTAIQVRPGSGTGAETGSDTPTQVSLPERPSLIGGRYQLQDMLGRGAFGEVYKALDNKLNRIVAVKILRPERLGTDPRSYLLRFEAEARTVAALDHPNIVPIYDTGEQDGLPWMVLQYVEGKTLRQMLDDNRRLPAEECEQIIAQLRRALFYAHSRDVIHRDVKPSNVLVLPDGTVKLMDFGVAKSGSSNLQTAEGVMIGTLNYMSPEQIRGKDLSGASDLFSLGCIWYELLTGKRAFDGPDATSIIYKIIHEEPAWPELDDEALSPQTRDILHHLLSKEPHQRLGALQDTSPPTMNARMGSSQDSLPGRVFPTEETPSSRSALGTVVILVLAAVALFFGWRWWQDREPEQAQAQGAASAEHDAPAPVLTPERTVFRIGVASFKGAVESEKRAGADLPARLQGEVEKRLLEQRGPELDIKWVRLGTLDHSSEARTLISKEDLDLLVWGLMEEGPEGVSYRPQFEHRHSAALHYVRAGLKDSNLSDEFWRQQAGRTFSLTGTSVEPASLSDTVDRLLLQVASGILYQEWETTVPFESHGPRAARLLRGVQGDSPAKLLFLADAVDDPELQRTYLRRAAEHPGGNLATALRVVLQDKTRDLAARRALLQKWLEPALAGHTEYAPFSALLAEALMTRHLLAQEEEISWCVHPPACRATSSDHLQEALNHIKFAITLEPDNGRWYWLRSRIHQLAGNPDEWRADLRKSIELGEAEGPLGDVFLAYTAVMETLEEDDTGALNCEWAGLFAEDLVTLSGNHPWAILLYFRIQDRCTRNDPERLKKNLKKAQEWFELAPESAALAWTVSDYYRELKDNENQLQWLKKAEALPDKRWRNLQAGVLRGFETTVYADMADIMDLGNDLHSAAAYARGAALHAPDHDYIFQFLYAVQLEGLGKSAESLAEYRRFASVHEQSMWGFIFAGWMQDAWVEMAQWAREAEDTADRQKIPEAERSPIPPMVLMAAYRAQDRLQEAEQQYDQAKLRMPKAGNKAAVQRAAWYLAMAREEKQDNDTALLLYKLVSLLEDLETDDREFVIPDAIYLRLHLGALHLRKGERAQARAAFEDARRLTGMDPFDTELLGEDRWPKPLIAYLLGEISEEELLAKTAEVEDRAAGRRVEVDYYLAVEKLVAGDTEGARQLLLDIYLSEAEAPQDWSASYADFILSELDPDRAHEALYEEKFGVGE